MREAGGNSAVPLVAPGLSAQLDLLKALAETGLTVQGLGRLLIHWSLELLPDAHCIVHLKRPAGGMVRLDGAIVAGEMVIDEFVDPPAEAAAEPPAEFGLESDDPGVIRLVDYSDAATCGPAECDRRGHWMGMPIVHGSDSHGHLAVFGDKPFSSAAWTSLSQLVSRFAFLFSQRFALDQASDLAFRDEVTGLHNRRYFRKALEQWVARAKRDRLPISLFLLDIDHFKIFNDTWGHATGDRVLQMIGSLLKSVFRNLDVVARFGGEEFAVLLCDHRKEDSAEHPREVLQFAERFRRAAETLSMTSEDGRRLSQITISGGIATFPWDATTCDALLQKADEALYRAKRSGRNRILLAERPDASSKAG